MYRLLVTTFGILALTYHIHVVLAQAPKKTAKSSEDRRPDASERGDPESEAVDRQTLWNKLPVYSHQPGSDGTVGETTLSWDGTGTRVRGSSQRSRVIGGNTRTRHPRNSPTADVATTAKTLRQKAKRMLELIEMDKRLAESIKQEEKRVRGLAEEYGTKATESDANSLQLSSEASIFRAQKKRSLPVFRCPNGHSFDDCKHHALKTLHERASESTKRFNEAIDAQMWLNERKHSDATALKHKFHEYTRKAELYREQLASLRKRREQAEAAIAERRDQLCRLLPQLKKCVELVNELTRKPNVRTYDTHDK